MKEIVYGDNITAKTYTKIDLYNKDIYSVEPIYICDNPFYMQFNFSNFYTVIKEINEKIKEYESIGYEYFQLNMYEGFSDDEVKEFEIEFFAYRKENLKDMQNRFKKLEKEISWIIDKNKEEILKNEIKLKEIKSKIQDLNNEQR